VEVPVWDGIGVSAGGIVGFEVEVGVEVRTENPPPDVGEGAS